MRIVQLSDTHISHLGGVPAANMSLLTSYINNELRPDLVVHTGDVVIANPTPRRTATRPGGCSARSTPRCSCCRETTTWASPRTTRGWTSR